jgi:2-oxoglutarate dehydrogenase complex dehydrogenase (E1) component-like enzyme
MSMNVPQVLGRTLVPITRTASSSPAAGSHHRHEQQQRDLVDRALA